MIALWQRLVPQLKQLPQAERQPALEEALRSRFTPVETVLLVAWMLGVFFLTQHLLRQADGEERMAGAVATNLLITAPLMLAVFVPVHLRRVRRHVASLVARRAVSNG